MIEKLKLCGFLIGNHSFSQASATEQLNFLSCIYVDDLIFLFAQLWIVKECGWLKVFLLLYQGVMVLYDLIQGLLLGLSRSHWSFRVALNAFGLLLSLLSKSCVLGLITVGYVLKVFVGGYSAECLGVGQYYNMLVFLYFDLFGQGLMALLSLRLQSVM